MQPESPGPEESNNATAADAEPDRRGVVVAFFAVILIVAIVFGLFCPDGAGRVVGGILRMLGSLLRALL